MKDAVNCCLLSNGIQDGNDMTAGVQNEWRDRGQSRKRKLFVSQSLCPYYRYLHNLVKEKKVEGLIFHFWVYKGTISMRQLQDSHVIHITHKSDI